MPTPDSTPFTDAPFALKMLWNKSALCGEVDTQDPPETVWGTCDQMIATQVRFSRKTLKKSEDLIPAEEDLMVSEV